MSSNSEEDVSPHVRLRVEPEQKKTWLEFIEESDEYTTLTDLIKTSVSNTINGEWVLVGDDEDESVPDELVDSVNTIDSRLDAIETQLDAAVLGEADPDDEQLNENELMNLARLCHSNLPIVQDGDHLRELQVPDIQHPPDIVAKTTGAAQAISKHINEPVSRVRKALTYLERQEISNVESIIHRGTRRWFEKDPTVERDITPRLDLEDEVDEDVELEWKSAATLPYNDPK